ncbi:hypothetical protein D3C72_2009200 [compost metagenome]
MPRMQLGSGLGQVFVQVVEAAFDLCPLHVDPGLVHFFGRVNALLVDDCQQAVTDAVA